MASIYTWKFGDSDPQVIVLAIGETEREARAAAQRHIQDELDVVLKVVDDVMSCYPDARDIALMVGRAMAIDAGRNAIKQLEGEPVKVQELHLQSNGGFEDPLDIVISPVFIGAFKQSRSSAMFEDGENPQ